MKKRMNKTAFTDIPLSPQEQYVASTNLGRSLFSALQLARIREARRQAEMYGDGNPEDESVLNIPIPEHMMPHPQKKASYSEDTVLGRAISSHSHPLRMVVGGQEGFRDAKKDYYLQEKAKIQAELANAQREYIELLSKIKTGSAEETPNVDAFCNGIAYQTVFEKEAALDNTQIEEGAVRRLLADTVDVARKPFMPAVDLAASGLLNTGVGGAYLTYLLRKKMREEPEKYMRDKLPTRIELQPYV
jgi:hypothetical protein